MFYSSLAVLLVASLATAASTQPAAPVASPRIQQNQQFTLVAKVVDSSLGLDVHNWVVGGNRVGAGQMAAVLTEAGPLDQAAGRMYQNGTTKDTLCGVGTNNVVAAGTGRIPYELQINPQPSPAPNSAVGINSAGAGTQGTGIMKGDDGVPHFVGNGQPEGQFYACNLTLFGPQPMQALYWRDASSPTPSGCAEVKLVPQCAGNLDN